MNGKVKPGVRGRQVVRGEREGAWAEVDRKTTGPMPQTMRMHERRKVPG